MRRRLDTELVRRGLVPDVEAAEALVAQGRVTVSGAPATNWARMVSLEEPLFLTPPPEKFVSRGGFKLDAALIRFDVDVQGHRALDVGASTGGFTDCLLQHGAAQVMAIDVGRAQLHWSLRNDPRVISREKTDIRSLQIADVGKPFEIVTVDVSFIGLRKIAATVYALTTPTAVILLLVKPQFEAAKSEVEAGGIVTHPKIHENVLQDVMAALSDAGLGCSQLMPSPIRGMDGNIEFFVMAKHGTSTLSSDQIQETVLEAHA